MSSLEERFEAKVDRSGDHHIWTGSKRADGSGQIKVEGRAVPARRIAWELEHGSLPEGADVHGCSSEKACVRPDHLSLRTPTPEQSAAVSPRAARGAGSKRQVRPGVWELSVTYGSYDDGRTRREYRTVEAVTEAEAEREKATFVAEIHSAPLPERKSDRDMTVTEGVEQYLEERLRGELGREERTVRGYRQVYDQWFAPKVGGRRLRDIDEATMDELFGEMRKAGVSKSRMNEAKSLMQPMFRWAQQRRIFRRSPMADFRLGKSLYVPRRRVTPEVDQLARYLTAAVAVVPEVAPVLTLGATTGMRLGEMVAIRRSRLDASANTIEVDTAADVTGIKGTKTEATRPVEVDAQTMTMLLRHCEAMDERAVAEGVETASDPFVFSLKPDCSDRMAPGYVSKRILVLKEHLGIANKRPGVVEREDEALRLFQKQPEKRQAGRRGPTPKGGMSYAEIGRQLGRSSRWAAMAVDSAQRRENAGMIGDIDSFDGSAIALRKFTSTELIDAGFNVAAVADRQGHDPAVLLRHYASGRKDAARKAADHLGNLVHGNVHTDATRDAGPSL